MHKKFVMLFFISANYEWTVIHCRGFIGMSYLGNQECNKNLRIILSPSQLLCLVIFSNELRNSFHYFSLLCCKGSSTPQVQVNQLITNHISSMTGMNKELKCIT